MPNVPRTMTMKYMLWKMDSKTLKSLLPTFLQLISLNSCSITNVLKIRVRCLLLSSLLLLVSVILYVKPAINGPKMISKTMTIVFQIETPTICLQITGVRSFASALNGGPWMTDGSGGSVERAKAANVSMIKLIHKS